jgi:hypothetical protein
MDDLLQECERLCREREGTMAAGWRFTKLQVSSSLHPGFLLLDYRREPIAPVEGFPLYVNVTGLYSADDIYSLLSERDGLRQLIPAAEIASAESQM